MTMTQIGLTHDRCLQLPCLQAWGKILSDIYRFGN